MPQLDATWFASQLFWLAITFAALYFVLSRFILPPLQEVIARRAGTIASDLDKAQRSKSDAQSAKEQYEAALAQARTKAQALTNEAMLRQKARMEQAGRDMDAKAAASLAEAEKRIEAKKRELTGTLSPAAMELAGMIVEKLTQKMPAADKLQAAMNDASKTRNG